VPRGWSRFRPLARVGAETGRGGRFAFGKGSRSILKETSWRYQKLLREPVCRRGFVETCLTEVNVVPGGDRPGECGSRGGSVAQEIQVAPVGRQAKVEVESGDQDYKQDIEVTKVLLAVPSSLQADRAQRPCRSGGDPFETWPITMMRRSISRLLRRNAHRSGEHRWRSRGHVTSQ